VGVDGSEGSVKALQWAASEARIRNARLHPVLAWEPRVRAVGGVAVTPNADEIAAFSRDALERLDSLLDAHSEELAGLDIERSAARGAAAPVLLEAARGATLLVVGTHGRSGLVGLLLGSVSRECARHAPCPVVIVPPSAGADSGAEDAR